MEMSDFVDDDDIENAPVDDTEAFVHYAKRAIDKFNKRTERWRGDEDDWHDLNEARMGFHNYILAIGNTYSVAPFSGTESLSPVNYANNEWRAFKAEFDFRMTQLIHSKARAIRADGFLLTENAKEGIRTHLSGLRKYILESELPEKTRKRLLAKVDEFEIALKGRQMNMNFIYAFAGFVFAHLADVTTIADSAIVHKLMGGVFTAAAEARTATEEFVSLSAPKPPLQIPGPGPDSLPPIASTRPPKESQAPPRESFSADLEDEIPF